jgi:Fe-S-cluster containining protein
MLVPVAEVEARRLFEVVEAMPEPRRSQIRERFAAAVRKLTDAGLSTKLRKTDQLTDEAFRELIELYFHQQVACPFLENESCSIYDERPISCREYLVTSPPANCARRNDQAIDRVRIPLPIFNALARVQVPPGKHLNERWVPLTYALAWAEKHPQESPTQTGTELVQELIGYLTKA